VDAGRYKTTGLPNKIPTVALIHPKNPDVLYFLLEQHLCTNSFTKFSYEQTTEGYCRGWRKTIRKH
jgi:hypothetical protein